MYFVEDLLFCIKYHNINVYILLLYDIMVVELMNSVSYIITCTYKLYMLILGLVDSLFINSGDLNRKLNVKTIM